MVADSDDKEKGLFGELPMNVRSQAYCDCLSRGGGGEGEKQTSHRGIK